MTSPTQQIGAEAETLACKYLIKQGLKLVTKNFRCRTGEIDLIMRDQQTLVFVEVRLRDNQDFGGGVGSIVHSKRQKIIRTASFYLQKIRGYNTQICRFDVVAIEKNQQNKLEWIKDAFQVQ